MHEVGLAEGIMETVRLRAADRPVARVRVRIGTLHRASQGPMEQAFEMVGAGTNLQDAQLELVQVPVRNVCSGCGNVEESADRIGVCAACGGFALTCEGGDELILESIEYREAAAPPVGSAAG